MKKIIYILIIVISFVFITGCQETNEDLGSDIDFSSLVFESVEVPYDGNEHSIYASYMPQGVVCEYVGNGVSEIGKHRVTLKIYHESGKLLKEVTAEISIVEKLDVELPSV